MQGGAVGEIVLMNHFASSDEFADSPSQGVQTRQQLDVFRAAAAGLDGARSLANSAAVLGWPEAHGDWIRPGGALYGISVVDGRTGGDFGLRSAMTLSTRLIAVNRVCKGGRIGYAGTWECPEDMDVGVAAIGYGDGYPRAAPAGTPVLVGGHRTQLIGRVSMDLMTIDLRSVPGARVGDPVTLWGAELPVETIASGAGTIGYELTCSITRRVRFFER
jgi:alanine racemase